MVTEDETPGSLPGRYLGVTTSEEDLKNAVCFDPEVQPPVNCEEPIEAKRWFVRDTVSTMPRGLAKATRLFTGASSRRADSVSTSGIDIAAIR